MHIGNYLKLVETSECQLAEAFTQVAEHHKDEPDIHQISVMMAGWSQDHVTALKPFVDRYTADANAAPERLNQVLFAAPRSGSLALLRDLHDLWLLSNEVHLCWVVILQAAQALRDEELERLCKQLDHQTHRQQSWLMTRIKQVAPQTLVVAA